MTLIFMNYRDDTQPLPCMIYNNGAIPMPAKTSYRHAI